MRGRADLGVPARACRAPRPACPPRRCAAGRRASVRSPPPGGRPRPRRRRSRATSAAEKISESGSRPAVVAGRRTRPNAASMSATDENGRLNSSAKRAASRGVRFVPPPPMIDRRPRRCDRLGQGRGVDELVVLPVERERRADRCVPEPGDDRQLFLEPVEALADRRERDAVGRVLVVVPAGAHAELDPAAAHGVDLGDRDGERPGRRKVAGVTSVPRRMGSSRGRGRRG